MSVHAWEPKCMQNSITMHGHAWPCKGGRNEREGYLKENRWVVWCRERNWFDKCEGRNGVEWVGNG